MNLTNNFFVKVAEGYKDENFPSEKLYLAMGYNLTQGKVLVVDDNGRLVPLKENQVAFVKMPTEKEINERYSHLIEEKDVKGENNEDDGPDLGNIKYKSKSGPKPKKRSNT